MKTFSFLFVMLLLFSCAQNSQYSELLTIQEKYNLKEKHTLFINWDHCSSCRSTYQNFILDYQKINDAEIIIFSNNNRNLNQEISIDGIKFIHIAELGNFYFTQPILMTSNDNKNLDFKILELN